MTRLQANLLLLVTGAIWGAGFVAQSTAMQAIGPLWFIGLRFAIASLVALPLALVEARRTTRPLARANLPGFAAVGLSLFGGAVTQQIGIQTTTVTNSGFLTGLYIIFVPILSVLLFRRMPHWVVWPAAAMSLFGIFLLGGGKLTALSSGDYLTIVCAVFWALQIIFIGIVGPKADRPMALSLTQFLICAIGGIALGMAYEPISLEALQRAVPEILFAGLFSSGIAFICQIVAQRHTTAAQAAIFLSSEALFAALFGVLLLGETIPPIGYAGCAILFLAMLSVEIVPELGKKDRSAATDNRG
ncbi:Threonine/homoserine efflux transporter RhtA [Rhizobium sp. RU20A]|uniref:DMT family transporter n=1 Tax=Rhizobium sp. RU20A TaxID=1907412 RepID=UPI0009542369|nr:DMT family transporter [Rhizobium sp. RU20A]SIQ25939.1 Threonine/homoserine efflux transporter RhtA [Rhizobium sp. RU20A]